MPNIRMKKQRKTCIAWVKLMPSSGNRGQAASEPAAGLAVFVAVGIEVMLDAVVEIVDGMRPPVLIVRDRQSEFEPAGAAAGGQDCCGRHFGASPKYGDVFTGRRPVPVIARAGFARFAACLDCC
jgi:hypothetical protein